MKFLAVIVILGLLLVMSMGCENNSPTAVKYRDEQIAACTAECAPRKGEYSSYRALLPACQCIVEEGAPK